MVPGLDTFEVTSPAVELFRERVRARDSAVVLDGDDLEIILEICRKLDGLPLAIELAAARVPLLSPKELLERLTECFEVLAAGRCRRIGDRHRTLRATVDWSYQLLASDE